MQAAVDEVRSLPDYSERGEVRLIIFFITDAVIFKNVYQWVMTDARHDSTSNAYHTTVVCITGRFGLCYCNIAFLINLLT